MSDDRPNKHAPAQFYTYFAAHDGHMDGLRKAGFVGDDTLTLEVYATSPPSMLLIGEISCKGDIIVQVTKRIDALTNDDNPPVQTVTYSYHALIRGGHSILRYDNQHGRNDHVDCHHRHVFDPETNEQIDGSPFWVGVDGWPTLGEVLEELMDWHAENYESLRNPEGFADPENMAQRLSQGFL